MDTPTIWRASREERLEIALKQIAHPIPSTKGMGPKDRAQRLHVELERRIAIARNAIELAPE